MHLNFKLPISISGIAEIMEMNEEEIRNWPQFGEVRDFFKDYNFNVLGKEKLIKKLRAISEQCAIKNEEKQNGCFYQYIAGIENAITTIKLCY